jgi:hypothetical protein
MELQGPAPRDSAGGLYNRAHFDDQLRREVDLSTREHREFALVAIEIDPIDERFPGREIPSHLRGVGRRGAPPRGARRERRARTRTLASARPPWRARSAPRSSTRAGARTRSR